MSLCKRLHLVVPIKNSSRVTWHKSEVPVELVFEYNKEGKSMPKSDSAARSTIAVAVYLAGIC